MKNFIDYLDKHPLISHAFLSAIYTLILIFVLNLFKIDLLTNCVVSALLISTYFYGRESGQFDHYLTRETGETAFNAWYKSLLFFFWTSSVIMQWVTPTIAAIVVAFIAYSI